MAIRKVNPVAYVHHVLVLASTDPMSFNNTESREFTIKNAQEMDIIQIAVRGLAIVEAGQSVIEEMTWPTKGTKGLAFILTKTVPSYE